MAPGSSIWASHSTGHGNLVKDEQVAESESMQCNNLVPELLEEYTFSYFGDKIEKKTELSCLLIEPQTKPAVGRDRDEKARIFDIVRDIKI